MGFDLKLLMDSISRRKSSAKSVEIQQKPNGNPFLNKTWDQYVYTTCLVFIGLFCTMENNLYSPALVDFKYMFHTTLNQVSFVGSFRNLGFLIGCLAGFAYNRINRQFTMAIMLLVLTIFTTFIPFCPKLWQVYLCTTIAQMGSAAFDCGFCVWLVEIWGKSSSTVLQLSKVSNGMGGILAPLLDRPFLVGELEIHNKTQYNHNQTAIDLAIQELNYSIDRRSKMKIPFLIGGVISLPIPIILLVMFFIKRYRPINSGEDSTEVVVDSKPKFTSKVRYLLIALISINISTFNGMEMIHLAYASTYYQNLPIHLSAQRAAVILSVMSGMLTIGKLLSVLISVKLKPEFIITYSYITLAISMAILYFGCNSELIIWIGNGIIGIGFGGVWAAYLCLANNYLGLSNSISAIFQATSTICPMISPFICGPLIEKDPQIFVITELAYFIISIFLLCIIMFIVKKLPIKIYDKNIYISRL